MTGQYQFFKFDVFLIFQRNNNTKTTNYKAVEKRRVVYFRNFEVVELKTSVKSKFSGCHKFLLDHFSDRPTSSWVKQNGNIVVIYNTIGF